MDTSLAVLPRRTLAMMKLGKSCHLFSCEPEYRPTLSIKHHQITLWFRRVVLPIRTPTALSQSYEKLKDRQWRTLPYRGACRKRTKLSVKQVVEVSGRSIRPFSTIVDCRSRSTKNGDIRSMLSDHGEELLDLGWRKSHRGQISNRLAAFVDEVNPIAMTVGGRLIVSLDHDLS